MIPRLLFIECHHSSFWEAHPGTGVFRPSWLSQWTWLEAASHWGCLGAPLQCLSSQCSRCHQHTSFKVGVSLGQCWVQALQSTLFKGWPLQQEWVNPLLCLPVVHRRLLHSWSRWTSDMSPATLQLCLGREWFCPATSGHLAVCYRLPLPIRVTPSLCRGSAGIPCPQRPGRWPPGKGGAGSRCVHRETGLVWN